MNSLRILLLAGAAVIAQSTFGLAVAQVATNIVPDAANAFDIGTISSQAGNVTTIDGGTIAGNALGTSIFHSFQFFDLGNGDVARWTTTQTDPALVFNVINRVTGGNASNIEGKIDSTDLPNATFFFVNPNGIVFGPGALVDVPGMAYFSTASSVNFFGSEKFSAVTPGGSTFSVANPQSFGFLGQQADILLDGAADLLAPGGRRLGLFAANIGVRDSSTLAAELDIVAVGQTAATFVLDELPVVGVATGEIFITNSRFDTASDGSIGGVALVGGQVTIDSSSVTAEASDLAAGGFLAITADNLLIDNSIVSTSTETAQSAGGFVLRANQARVTGNSVLSSDTFGAGNAGLVLVSAGSLAIDSGASIKSDARIGSTGNGGNVLIGANILTIDRASISADTSGTGNAGFVLVRTNDLDAPTDGPFFNSIRLGNGSFISSDANGGSTGHGGNVTVSAGSLQVLDSSFISSDARAGARGDAGFVTINASSIDIFSSRDLTKRGGIRSETSGIGRAGDVTINTDMLSNSAGNISSNALAGSTGNAGFVTVNAATSIDILDNGSISSDTTGGGFGGDVTIDTNMLSVSDQSFISSDANEGSTGDAGSVSVAANSIIVSDFGFISSDARPTSQGNANFVSVTATDITLDTSGAIRSNTSEIGFAGNINVKATNLTVTGGGNISSSALDFSSGDAGSVNVNATNLTLANGGFISTAAGLSTFGNAGFVSINATSLSLRGTNTAIQSNTSSFGIGGDVTVNTGTLSVTDNASISSNANASSSGFGGRVSITATKSATLSSFGSIATDTFGSGRGGDVFLKTGMLSLTGSAFISSDSNASATGDAGSVSIDATGVDIASNAFISSDATGDGFGGNVQVTAKTLAIKSGGRVSARANAGSTGDAGLVAVNADSIDLNAGSIVSTSLLGASGRSGNIVITAKTISISNAGSIESSSSNANTAGFVGIETASLLIDGSGSMVSSENLFVPAGQSPRATGSGTASGAAGDISVAASAITLNQGGAITTNSLNGPAGSIFLILPSGSFLRLESAATPSLITTSSGPGTGGVINISSPFAIISNGGSILAKGQQGGADVVIKSNNFIRSADRANLVSVDGSFLIDSNLTDVSSGTTTPATNFLDASKVLSGQCAATRASGETSVLSARKTGPYAVAPPTQPTSMRSSGSVPLGGCL